ncbi:unnamed protein product [Trichogramma brassicae]|uniref:Uncharacterized protein n=1 Tax=Trichogramma brassicae TaxID=86971 RepID=A0A6H5IDS8_9HYME|nr:unnamed protein product [Trichogramma brassicae]
MEKSQTDYTCTQEGVMRVSPREPSRPANNRMKRFKHDKKNLPRAVKKIGSTKRMSSNCLPVISGIDCGTSSPSVDITRSSLSHFTQVSRAPRVLSLSVNLVGRESLESAPHSKQSSRVSVVDSAGATIITESYHLRGRRATKSTQKK